MTQGQLNRTVEHRASPKSSTAQPDCERLRGPSGNQSTLGEKTTCPREVKYLIPTAGAICPYIPHSSSRSSTPTFPQGLFPVWLPLAPIKLYYRSRSQIWRHTLIKLILRKAEAPEEFLLCLADGFVIHEGIRTGVGALHTVEGTIPCEVHVRVAPCSWVGHNLQPWRQFFKTSNSGILINKVEMMRILEEQNQIPRIHGSMAINGP